MKKLRSRRHALRRSLQHVLRPLCAAPLLLAATSAWAAPTFGRVGSTIGIDPDLGDITVAPGLPPLSTGIALSGRVVTVTGGSGVDTVTISAPVRGNFTVTRNSFSQTYATSQVDSVVFYGNAGDDVFTNNSSIPSEAYGGDGNDTLNGGGGDDFLVGGYGQDTVRGYGGDDVVWGSGGSDWLYGGIGNDHIKGHGGNDQLLGESGNDALYGGSGDDTLNGGSGVDTLVSIGGDFDTVAGGTSNDFFWVDSTDSVTDASTLETGEKFINRVSSFYRYSYDGGTTSTAVAKDLTSYDLADPVPLDEHASEDLENYASHPLFSSFGPTKEDVIQGSVGDCFILGPLSAVADATPDSIRKLVVDLDDGTYAVRFFRTVDGAAEFVRVDADLYTRSTGALRYARVGLEDSIWVPIVEKAFAFFRRQDGDYASISGGNGEGEGPVILGADNTTVHATPLLTPGDPKDLQVKTDESALIAFWDATGRQPGSAVSNHVNSTVVELLEWIVARQAEGRPVYTGIRSNATNTSPIVVDNWRRGEHIVMVDHVLFDQNGVPNGVVLRDQIGPTMRTFTDFARIYVLIGRARLYEMP